MNEDSDDPLASERRLNNLSNRVRSSMIREILGSHPDDELYAHLWNYLNVIYVKNTPCLNQIMH